MLGNSNSFPSCCQDISNNYASSWNCANVSVHLAIYSPHSTPRGVKLAGPDMISSSITFLGPIAMNVSDTPKKPSQCLTSRTLVYVQLCCALCYRSPAISAPWKLINPHSQSPNSPNSPNLTAPTVQPHNSLGKPDNNTALGRRHSISKEAGICSYKRADLRDNAHRHSPAHSKFVRLMIPRVNKRLIMSPCIPLSGGMVFGFDLLWHDIMKLVSQSVIFP
ncbi:hypothetical protein F4819DRAFT_383742 [Hypoxylon fuscum]|nr:hypothetical protein F4819DRAFT_383742 [Hypoxylon fuscum]